MKLLTWNINGIRASIKKGLWEVIKELDVDVFCFQETKAVDEVIKDLAHRYSTTFANNFDESLFTESKPNKSKIKQELLEYYWNWQSATSRKGYSGVLTGYKSSTDWSKKVKPQIGLGINKFDVEGRVIVTKFKKNKLKFALINCYYPQGGRGQYRIDYKLEFYKQIYDLGIALHNQDYSLILTGDFNTTVTDIDLARPKENKENTGCLPEERLAMSWLLGVKDQTKKDYDKKEYWTSHYQVSEDLYQDLSKQMKGKSLNLVDGFRYFYPNLSDKYTYWDQITRARDRNVGWRIDMFLVDQTLIKNLKSCEILDGILGSDHCPVMIEFEF